MGAIQPYSVAVSASMTPVPTVHVWAISLSVWRVVVGDPLLVVGFGFVPRRGLEHLPAEVADAL